jgi:uncharacterized protein with GYD domain
MARYLWQASYTPEGIRALVHEGGTSRREAIERITVEELGGVVESFYFAFGEHDVYVIADVPDHVTAAAISLAVAASGAATVKTTVLLTPEEVDAATRKAVDYRPPGVNPVGELGDKVAARRIGVKATSERTRREPPA